MSGAVVSASGGALSLPAAARHLGISKRGLERLVAAGAIRSILIGRRRLFRLADLDAFLAEKARAGAAVAKKVQGVVLSLQRDPR
jgi:excisionase family DNA binding protein